jgi:hypothetical protein
LCFSAIGIPLEGFFAAGIPLGVVKLIFLEWIQRGQLVKEYNVPLKNGRTKIKKR